MKKTLLLSIAMIILTLVIMSAMTWLNVGAQSLVRYYAKIVKYPTLAYPEPVLAGGNMTVRIVLPNTTEPTGFTLKLYNEYNTYDLNFASDVNKIKAIYSSLWKAWVVNFTVNKDVKPGFYNYEIKFTAGGKNYDIVMPHAIWVLKSWPHVLKILVTGDTKTPAGWPYWSEMVSEANLIHPNLFIFDGDEVDRPTMSSAWRLFMEGWLSLNIPSYAVIGNHEYSMANVAHIWDQIMGYRNYSVTIGKFLIIGLNSGFTGWIPMNQLKWAENILKHNPDKVKIMVWHHPLFGYKIRDDKIAVIKVNSTNDFDKLFKEGYIYGSWSNHEAEAKYLFTIILKYGVHLLFTAHTHTDINNMVIYNGSKYYFITMSGVPYDVRAGDKRGFRLFYIYDNGTFTANTLTYPPGTPLNHYPNSIWIDSGEGSIPYILGYLDYYYTPANDGTHHAVSFKAVNHLNMTFHNIFIQFKLPKDIPISKYKIVPKPKNYTVINGLKYYFVRINGVDLKPNTEVTYTIYAIPDKDVPKIESVEITNPAGTNWFRITTKATDNGWGVKDISITYNNGNGWKPVKIVDINTWDSNHSGAASYNFWIKGLKNGAKVNVTVTDFAGHTTSKLYVYNSNKGLIPATAMQTTTTTSITSSSMTTTTYATSTTSSTTSSPSPTTTYTTTTTSSTTTTQTTTTATTTTITTQTTTSAPTPHTSISSTSFVTQIPSYYGLATYYLIGAVIALIVVVGALVAYSMKKK